MNCFKCLCTKCINNCNNLRLNPNEKKISSICLNCDSCYYYDLKKNKSYLKKIFCKNFIISEFYTKEARRRIKIIRNDEKNKL